MANQDKKLTDEEVLGLAIRRVRLRAKISQRAVEHRGALARGFVSRIELGNQHALWGTVRRIAKGIGVELGAIMREVKKIECMEAEGSATPARAQQFCDERPPH